MFSSQSQMHGPEHASAFMRNYFKEMEGKPLPPANPPRSTFAIYRAEQFKILGCNANGVKGTGKQKKNYAKQVSGAWSSLEADLKAPYDEKLASLNEVFEVESEAYEEALAIWKAAKDEAGAGAGAGGGE